MNGWSIVNAACKSPLAAQITPEWLDRCAVAMTHQLTEHFAPHYGGDHCVTVATPTTIPTDDSAAVIQDEFEDEPDAVAYHDLSGTQDVPTSFVSLAMCDSLDAVSEAQSHEFLEAGADASCNIWARRPDGIWIAYEVSDPIELNSYPIDLGDGQPPIVVSDFVLPSYWMPGGKAPFTYMQAMGLPGHYPVAALSLAAGGYLITCDAAGNEAQVTAHAASARGARVKAGAHHWASRAARRGVPRRPTR